MPCFPCRTAQVRCHEREFKMLNNRNRYGKNQTSASEETSDTSMTAVKAAAPQAADKTVRGQKYVSPEGRHSQQTHRRAEERATANGHTTEKEQHAHDRNAVETEINRVEQAKANQKAQNARGATPKV